MSKELNKEEIELLESYENDEWVSISDDINKYRAAAKNTFKKTNASIFEFQKLI